MQQLDGQKYTCESGVCKFERGGIPVYLCLPAKIPDSKKLPKAFPDMQSACIAMVASEIEEKPKSRLDNPINNLFDQIRFLKNFPFLWKEKFVQMEVLKLIHINRAIRSVYGINKQEFDEAIDTLEQAYTWIVSQQPQFNKDQVVQLLNKINMNSVNRITREVDPKKAKLIDQSTLIGGEQLEFEPGVHELAFFAPTETITYHNIEVNKSVYSEHAGQCSIYYKDYLIIGEPLNNVRIIDLNSGTTLHSLPLSCSNFKSSPMILYGEKLFIAHDIIESYDMKLEDILFHLYDLSVLPALPVTQVEATINRGTSHFLVAHCGKKWIEISSFGCDYSVELNSTERSFRSIKLPMVSMKVRISIDCLFFTKEKLVISYSCDLLRYVLVYSIAGNQFSRLSWTDLDLKSRCPWLINHMHHFEINDQVHLVHIESLSRITVYTLTAQDHIKKKKTVRTSVSWHCKRWLSDETNLWTSSVTKNKRVFISQKKNHHMNNSVYHPQVILQLKL